MITLSVPILVLVFSTSFLSGVFGVAGGLILMGGLLYFVPVSDAMLVHGIAQFVSNASRVYFWRNHLVAPAALWFLGGVVLCAIPYAFVLYVPSEGLVLLLLGLSAIVMQIAPASWAPNILKPHAALLCGVGSTALQLSSGVSGTFVDMFFLRTGLDRRSIVATNAAMQSLLHLLKTVYFGAVAWTAAFGQVDLALLAAVPFFAVVGSRLGGYVLIRLTDVSFFTWTNRILIVLGIYYTASGVLWYL